MSAIKKHRTSPAQIILLGFLGLILAGTGLLMLPVSTRTAGGASFFDALFTATSATCVTGLVVQDTAQYWSPFGQAVILTLIQIGGMGVITIALLLFRLTGKKISIKQRWVMQESIAAPQVGGIVRMTGFIFTISLALEAIGAALLAIRFCPQYGWKGLWYALFHSISAFCNAGFDLMGINGTPFASMTGYYKDPLVLFTLMALIVIGGIGFLVWYDFRENRLHLHRYRLQSKVVLFTSAGLLLVGFLFFLFEFHQPQWEGLTLWEKVENALFQSVTARTAGFNTVDYGGLSQPTQLVMLMLMLVGGSPGSTAGGFKTTTLAVVLLSIRAVFNRRDNLHCFGRRISDETVRSAMALITLYLLLFISGGIVICYLDGIPLLSALFETASAIATVGLSLVGTANLCLPSRMILAALMYFGRVGGLTLLYAVASGGSGKLSQYPQEKMTVG